MCRAIFNEVVHPRRFGVNMLFEFPAAIFLWPFVELLTNYVDVTQGERAVMRKNLH